MLHEFLIANRLDLIDRCKSKVALRSIPKGMTMGAAHGIPLFVDQIIKTLQMEQTSEPQRSRKISGAAGGDVQALSELGEAATLHGRELQKMGFTIDQVVHDYGDLCQAITDLAFERDVPIDIDEFRTLNRCLDNAIAVAVTEFSYQHDFVEADRHTMALNERLGVFAHELRNVIMTATLATTAIKAGQMGLGGATGAVLDRSLARLSALIDSSLAEVRMNAGLAVQHRLFSLSDLIAEVRLSATLEAKIRKCEFIVSDVDPQLAVDADRDLLLSALGNLLQNAFKFTRVGSEVTLNAYAIADRILVDVEDSCGGLPSGAVAAMFRPFTQSSSNKTGLGLGLSIAKRSVEASSGVLTVRDIPGSGCVFTINLPRHSLPKHVLEEGSAVQ